MWTNLQQGGRLGVLVAVIGVTTVAVARADVVTDWNSQVFTAVGGNSQRTLAMVHLAMFDAINAIEPRYRAYLSLPTPRDGASPEAAAASAAYGVLVRVAPGQAAAWLTALNASLAGIPDGQAKTDGVAFGDVVAKAIYDARLGDNILIPGPLYVSTGLPGVYQLTTPGPPQPVNSGARTWVPFALASASQFRPGPPPDLSSIRYARDVNETHDWGGTVSAFRSAHDDETARWMTEQSPFSLNRVLRAEVASDGKGLLAHARIFALLNVAFMDAVIAVFDAKYTYLFWRPVTAIRNADVDGNDRTGLDASWSSYQVTPAHPEYPAAHGSVTTAGARVLERYFGQHYAFDATSPAVPGVTRTYESFDAFAEDAGWARIVGGMHFRNSIEVGQRQGRSVANWVMGNILQPLDDTPAPHVRDAAPEIHALIQAGMAGSATFRALVSELDASDVIVYVQPKLTRQVLGGYLSHTIFAAASHRYLRVAIEIAGPPRSRVPVLAHELQHAIEVSRVRGVRDAESLERLFAMLALPYGCAQTLCFETEAAKNVERLVRLEMSSR